MDWKAAEGTEKGFTAADNADAVLEIDNPERGTRNPELGIVCPRNTRNDTKVGRIF